MAVLLEGFKYRTAGPRVIDFGGKLTPGTGAAVQRINRGGTRYGLRVDLPPLPEEPTGRIVSAKLQQALEDEALFAFPQPGLKIGSPGAPVVNGTVAGGTTLPARSFTPHYALRYGQFFSIVHQGRRYLHRVAAAVIADAAGVASISIMPALRTDLADADVIEVGKPMIQGLLEVEGGIEWEIMLEPFVSIAFTISEAR